MQLKGNGTMELILSVIITTALALPTDSKSYMDYIKPLNYLGSKYFCF